MRADELALTSRDGSTEQPQSSAAGEVADWVRRARAGDHQAFSRLVQPLAW